MNWYDQDTQAEMNAEMATAGMTEDYFGSDLTPGMNLRMDGQDWNIEHVFPAVSLRFETDGDVSNVPDASRDLTKSILHLSTFIRHAAYVIDNGDTFSVIV